MHEVGGSVVTGSKDGAAALLRVTPTGLVHEAAHNFGVGVLKSVRWWRAGPTCFAAAGDGDLALFDPRCGGKTSAGLTLVSGAHARRIDCVRWSPRDDHLLLSNGGDRPMRLHDVRSNKGPVLELVGHTKATQIDGNYHPSFTHGGAAISCLGHMTNRLSIFRVADGARVSEGELVDERGAPRAEFRKGGCLQTVSLGGTEVLMLGAGKGLAALLPCKV